MPLKSTKTGVVEASSDDEWREWGIHLSLIDNARHSAHPKRASDAKKWRGRAMNTD
jgi:hypothetical protein